MSCAWFFCTSCFSQMALTMLGLLLKCLNHCKQPKAQRAHFNQIADNCRTWVENAQLCRKSGKHFGTFCQWFARKQKAFPNDCNRIGAISSTFEQVQACVSELECKHKWMNFRKTVHKMQKFQFLWSGNQMHCATKSATFQTMTTVVFALVCSLKIGKSKIQLLKTFHFGTEVEKSQNCSF